MLRNVFKFFRPVHPLCPVRHFSNFNESASNLTVKRLGLVKPVSGPIRIVDDINSTPIVSSEHKSDQSDSERMRQREQYKAYREYLERRRRSVVVSTDELKQTLKKSDEVHKTFSKYG